VQDAVGRLGAVDVLINNAGITRDNVLLRMKEDQWDQVMAVNLKGTFNCTKAAIKIMIRQKQGTVINIASSPPHGNAGQANYSASKAGVIGLPRPLPANMPSGDNRERGCAGIHPDGHDRCHTRKGAGGAHKPDTAEAPGHALDVARVVLFLASDEAAYITGQVISVNGGLYM